MRLPAVVTFLVLALAGCADGGGEDPATPASPSPTAAPEVANTSLAPPLPVTFEMAGCLQLHTFFPFPTAVFTSLGFQLPPGFTFASDDGQTVQAFLAWWFCPEGRLNHSVNQAPFEVGSMFAALPVVPPSDLVALDPRTGDVQQDLVLLSWIVSSQLASDHLGRIDGLRGGFVESGDVALTSRADAGGAVAHAAVAPASYGLRGQHRRPAAGRPQPGGPLPHVAVVRRGARGHQLPRHRQLRGHNPRLRRRAVPLPGRARVRCAAGDGRHLARRGRHGRRRGPRGPEVSVLR